MNGNCNIDSQMTRQSGFTLFEVLIAIAVTSIGLLGLAAMQAIGLKNNQNAYHNTQSTVLAYDIADRMRANADSMNNYLTNYVSPEETPTEGEEEGDVPDLPNCNDSSGCTAAQMAQSDLLEWNAAVASALPSGTGTITIAADIYTATISWDGDQDGDVDNADPNFQVSFQP